jgi:very-short-patch-repair endonuclease
VRLSAQTGAAVGTPCAYWPRQGLVVELDGYGYHRSRERFEQDHEATERLQRAEATERLQRAGLEARRLTPRRVQEQPAAVLEALGMVLASREDKALRG